MPVYRRFRDRGRLAPDGLRYVNSWVTSDLQSCYQVIECDDRRLLEAWMDAVERPDRLPRLSQLLRQPRPLRRSDLGCDAAQPGLAVGRLPRSLRSLGWSPLNAGIVRRSPTGVRRTSGAGASLDRPEFRGSRSQ